MTITKTRTGSFPILRTRRTTVKKTAMMTSKKIVIRMTKTMKSTMFLNHRDLNRLIMPVRPVWLLHPGSLRALLPLS